MEKERCMDLRVTKVLVYPPKGKQYIETLLSIFSMENTQKRHWKSIRFKIDE